MPSTGSVHFFFSFDEKYILFCETSVQPSTITQNISNAWLIYNEIIIEYASNNFEKVGESV